MNSEKALTLVRKHRVGDSYVVMNELERDELTLALVHLFENNADNHIRRIKFSNKSKPKTKKDKKEDET